MTFEVCLEVSYLRMIDKIEAMIERGTPLRSELSWLQKANPFDFEERTVRPSKFYNAVADLRPMGFEAMLHIDQKRYHTSKIELLETGKKGIAEMQNTMERIVDIDPAKLRLGRVDLAADVKNVSLGWFREHAYVEYKQFVCAHAKVVEDEQTEMGKKIYQTLYYGKRPSCVRIYDKVAERVAHFELLKRRENRIARKEYEEYKASLEEGDRDLFQWPQLPTVQEWLSEELPQILPCDFEFGANRSQQPVLISGASPAEQSPFHFPVLTRVENQFGGRVPDNLYTMGEMRKNVLDFNPFERMRLVRGAVIPPGLFDKNSTPWGAEKYRFRVLEWMAYMYVRDNWKTLGAAQMWSMLNRDRNGRLYLRKMKEFLPVEEDDSPGISGPELYDCYRDSVSRQLAA